jgi:iron complex outermembrane recepter protein
MIFNFSSVLLLQLQKMYKIIVVIAMMCIGLNGKSQPTYSVKGKIADELGNGMPGAHVHYKSLCSVAGESGEFSFDAIPPGEHLFCITFIGYKHIDTFLVVPLKNPLVISMSTNPLSISEVSVKGRSHVLNGTRSIESVSSAYLAANQSGSLMKSLEKLPGINAMDIGANLSKPVVRGLGFHRVVVTENGIKQEGQQWGADHGLEIDPLNVDQLILIKGASSLENGSGALGGNISIMSNLAPKEPGLHGSVSLSGRTVNQSPSASLAITQSLNNFYIKGRASVKFSADYSIPADTIVYLTRPMPIDHRRLKNSAGKELSGFLQLGYNGTDIQHRLTFSDVYQKSGFFPGAHGIPSLERVKHDGDHFNIEFPFQEVNHIKLVGNSSFSLPVGMLSVDWGWQNNQRMEWSKFHTHYPGQQPPVINPDLELLFKLDTYTLNAKFVKQINREHVFTLGVQQQIQHNAIDGYNFLLPEYSTFNVGGFISHRWQPTVKWTINGGIRFDFLALQSGGYYDELLFNYLRAMNYSETESAEYAWRSGDIEKTFSDFSWTVGVSHLFNPRLKLSANLGRSFRNPTPIELGANGIHHGSFRHERGDPDLESENGYYFDLELLYNTEHFTITVGGYQYLFSNFIFLNPTGKWSVLPHAGQLYQYTQSPVWMNGVEIGFDARIADNWLFETNIEAIFNQQISDDIRKRYPLPFTPPSNITAELSYLPVFQSRFFSEGRLFLQSRIVFDQNVVSRNEQKTPGYTLIDTGLSVILNMRNVKPHLWLSVNNLFNRAYLNHISFYRKLELPEPGRDIRLTIKIPF